MTQEPGTTPDPYAFLAGGGEMGGLIRSMDWSSMPLGAVESWPQSLRTTVNVCLASDLPICVIWGHRGNGGVHGRVVSVVRARDNVRAHREEG